jgi:CRISPR/Cas system-associated exonuclease Cas4 (RecB family)
MARILTQDKLEEIYELYLRKEGTKSWIEKHVDKEEGVWFSASAAGHCYRKHKYKLLKEKAEAPDRKGLFRMRVGDLIHEDFQKALLRYYKDKLVLTELEIELKDLNVRGYLDIVVLDKQEADLKDVKTAAAFAWKRKFGRIQNRDLNQSEKYELQLGTYGLGLEETKGLQVVNMDLVYYKKDDSGIKFVNISDDYKKKAKEYWEEVSTVCKRDINNIIPGEDVGIPFESWECNYCQYKKVCPSPFKKEK